MKGLDMMMASFGGTKEAKKGSTGMMGTFDKINKLTEFLSSIDPEEIKAKVEPYLEAAKIKALELEQRIKTIEERQQYIISLLEDMLLNGHRDNSASGNSSDCSNDRESISSTGSTVTSCDSGS